ncbi:unnamed protein product [Didymodactylos carnosus]|uniref:N-acetylglucosamine-6-phosphate deacetylase n=1 Tax=Didymodactylos carnosus TaxID=1234261 RepID=A0A814NKU9_9BILA|nr:unnamed protein product [Didymodactylos carnosus]CAF1091850.1 unnamed protein product [Didymodactylos carnosus]CAF3738514.1 unnamed protein product [Didymodactylos carnosus]CAF3857330.1 unnamed protein product [Didymodactylos carnosus]
MLVRNNQLINDDLWIRNGKIMYPQDIFFKEKRKADYCFDCKGAIISPGYIDLQINGGFGYDFSFPDESTAEKDILLEVAKELPAYGTTAFCPTIVTSLPETYKKLLPRYQRRKGSAKDGATVLGVHVEGPFIDPTKHGAHRTDFLRQVPNGMDDILDCYGSLDNVSIITIAPEIPNVLEHVIPRLVDEYGIIVSLGHSLSNLTDGEKAVCAGARFITHLFNAMSSFHHRDPGLIGLLTSHQLSSSTPVYYGLIVDGIHTHSAAVRLAHCVHPNGLVLVTDAVIALGFSDGEYNLGENKITVKGKRATICGEETLAGSIASMSDCVKYFRQALLDGETNNSIYIKHHPQNEKHRFVVEAINSATLHPAQVLKIDKQKGTLNYGADADFILLDHDLNVLATYIGGDQAWCINDEWSNEKLLIKDNEQKEKENLPC